MTNEEIAAMIEANSTWVPVTGCRLWLGGASKGYGRVRIDDSNSQPVHRVAYQAEVGPIPDDLFLDHLCRVTLCSNTAHLEPVPNGVNVLRGVGAPAKNARMTHCRNGHSLDKTTRPGDAKHQRKCSICANERLRARRAAKKKGSL